MSVNIAKLIEAMGTFAANTKNDALSVRVARTANKLAYTGAMFESHYAGKLTAGDRAIIRPFIKQQMNEKKAA